MGGGDESAAFPAISKTASVRGEIKTEPAATETATLTALPGPTMVPNKGKPTAAKLGNPTLNDWTAFSPGLKRKTQWLRANVIPKITNMEITSTRKSFPFSSSPLGDVWATPTKSATGNTNVISNTFRLATC